MSFSAHELLLQVVNTRKLEITSDFYEHFFLFLQENIRCGNLLEGEALLMSTHNVRFSWEIRKKKKKNKKKKQKKKKNQNQ